MAGLTDTGFEPKTEAEIILERQAAYRANIDPDLNVNVADPDSAAGREIAIESEREALVWQLLEALYLALDLNTAGGILLDRLADLAGLTRRAATPSTVALDLTGFPVSTIPAGAVASTVSGVKVALDADVVLDVNGLGSGTATATTPGATEIDADTITEIVSPVVGWLTVNNPAAATPGTDTETDTELRGRIREPATNSSDTRSPYDGLLTEVMAIDEVQYATVIVNADDFDDAAGRPPHSFEVVVYGAGIDSDELAAVIWRHQLVGGRSYGTVSETIIDAGGGTQTVKWSTATELEVQATATGTKVSALYPVDGDEQIRSAIQDYIDGLAVGEEVTAWGAGLVVNGIPGIRTLTITFRDKAVGGAYAGTLAAGETEKPIVAVYPGDITVTMT